LDLEVGQIRRSGLLSGRTILEKRSSSEFIMPLRSKVRPPSLALVGVLGDHVDVARGAVGVLRRVDGVVDLDRVDAAHRNHVKAEGAVALAGAAAVVSCRCLDEGIGAGDLEGR